MPTKYRSRLSYGTEKLSGDIERRLILEDFLKNLGCIVQ